MDEHELIEVRLEKLAQRLRREGVIRGPERDLLVDAALLIRGQRAMLREARSGVDEAVETIREIRAELSKEQS